jgi:hypothetical protein
MTDLDQLCRNGLAALDEVLASKAPPEKDLIAEATRCTARFRDALIDEMRERKVRGDTTADPRLAEVNSLLSELSAAEFPLAGVRRERIEMARDAYRRLIQRPA